MSKVRNIALEQAIGTYVITLNGRPAANYIAGWPTRVDAERETARYTGGWVTRPVEVTRVTHANADRLLASCVLIDRCR